MTKRSSAQVAAGELQISGMAKVAASKNGTTFLSTTFL
jgi:hypothetical protein